MGRGGRRGELASSTTRTAAASLLLLSPLLAAGPVRGLISYRESRVGIPRDKLSDRRSFFRRVGVQGKGKEEEEEFELTPNLQPASVPSLPTRFQRWLLAPSLRLVPVPKLKLRLEPQQKSSKPKTTVDTESTSRWTKCLLPGFDGSSPREPTRREVISRRLWMREEISRREMQQQPTRGRSELDLPASTRREERRREVDRVEEEDELEGRRAREEEQGARVGKPLFPFGRLETLWGVEGE